MGKKTLDEILADARTASGEASIKLPTLVDGGDFVSFEVLQVLLEHKYKDETQSQTNLVVQVASGHAAGEDIAPGKYKAYMGSATLDRIVHTYGFKPGDRVALVLQRELSTGKNNPMKDFSVEIFDSRERDVKRDFALQKERRGVPVVREEELEDVPAAQEDGFTDEIPF